MSLNENFYFLKVDGKVEKVVYQYDTEKPALENGGWKNIPKEQFLSVKEIAQHQLERFSVEQRIEFHDIPKEELGMLHFSYGMWLRNTYGLWHPNNPFVVKDDLGDGHPDGLSMLVIKEMHQMLNTFVPSPRDTRFEDAMSIVEEKK